MNHLNIKAKGIVGKVCFPRLNQIKNVFFGYSLMIILSGMSFQAIANDTNTEELSFLSGKVVYDKTSGTFDVYFNGIKIIDEAYSVFNLNGSKIRSFDYSIRQVIFQEISDSFGVGEKMTVYLQEDGFPDLQQIFYSYDGKEYFLMEIVIKGNDIKSNYMAPLKSPQVYVVEEGNNRFLSVPFDNDTFIRYKSYAVENDTPLVSSEVTAFYEDNSRLGLVVGSVEHNLWKTGIKASGANNRLSLFEVFGGFTNKEITRDIKDHGYLEGDSIKSPKIFIGLFEDWRNGLEEYGKTNLLSEPKYISSWKGNTPIGWNSWGAMQTELSLEKVKDVIDFFANELTIFRSGETVFIDLDSYWDNLVDGGLEGNFSNLVSFVNYCKSKGFKPGIYWAPFVDWGKYVRKVEGSSYYYNEVWTKVNGKYHDLDGCRAMDPTHPATHERIKFLINRFILCGFEMIKIDFIGHAAIEADEYYDSNVKTGMQAFNKGMQVLIDEIGNDMFIYAAISPNFATNRYVHSRRIACDAYSDINATEYTLNSNTYGWWLSYMYDYIDGDHIVFGKSSLGENRARLVSGLINGTLFLGDDFSKEGPWIEKSISLLQNRDIIRIIQDGEAFKPVDGSSNQASEIFVRTGKKSGEIIAVVNFSEKEKVFDLDLSRLGIETKGSLNAREIFFGENVEIVNNTIRIKVNPKDARILEISKGNYNDIKEMKEVNGAFAFPNPVCEELNIFCPRQIKEICVNSLEGRLVKMYEVNEGNRFILDMKNMDSGVYFVTVIDECLEKFTYKVIRR